MPATEEATVYKTVIRSRHPETKLHETLGPAKAAIAYSGHWGNGVRGGQLYQLHHGEWHLRYDVPYNTAREDLPWKKK